MFYVNFILILHLKGFANFIRYYIQYINIATNNTNNDKIMISNVWRAFPIVLEYDNVPRILSEKSMKHDRSLDRH